MSTENHASFACGLLRDTLSQIEGVRGVEDTVSGQRASSDEAALFGGDRMVAETS